ncbi:MAG: diacylglycerol kinase family protein [Bacillota bacterium]|nr:diacylglycerol kinase family protein [Bacillota bacterium]
MSRRTFAESFKDAGSGMRYCLGTQRNMRIHLAVACIALIAAWVMKLDRLEVALVVFAISLVLVAEMFNTALEKTIDLFITTYHPLARTAKHIAAGAVLVAALNAVLTGFFVFAPHLRACFG